MLDAAIVWASESAPSPAIPALLQSWAAARGLRLVLPSDGGRHTIPVDMGVSKSIEESLHQSRELMAQHDADGTERALAHAEGLVRAHPELPQAAWLLAEIERGWAARFAELEPIDRARAERHWRAAASLDGGRVAGIGEPAVTGPDASLPWHLDVVGHADDVLLDGHPVTSRETPGLHQLVAVVSGQVVLAQWIGIAQGSNVRVVLPTPEACSRADFDSGSAACPSWVSVRRDGERFFVRSCAHATCGAELLVARMPELPPRHEARRRGLPPWAIWTLGAAGVVAAGVIAGVVTWFAVPPVQQTVWKQQP